MLKQNNCLEKQVLSILILLVFLTVAFAVEGDTTNNTILSEQRRVELHNLLVQDCGSCHGMTMKGGLGPALTPAVLKTKSRKMIEITILHGRPGTPMPPWNAILTKDEVRWIVDTLYAGVGQ